MKKIILVIGFFTFLTQVSTGQVKTKKVDILWGVEQKESKESTLSDIVGYDNTGIYAIKTKVLNVAITFSSKSSYYLEHYNNKMIQSNSAELDLKEGKKRKDYEFIVQLDNALYLFTSLKNNKLKQNFLFVQSINKKTLLLNNDLKKIAQIDYAGNRKYNAGNFNYKTSRDSSKILIYYDLPYEQGASEKFGFHVFDNKLNQLWEKKIVLPYIEELFDIEDYKVGNSGNVYLLGLIYKEKRKSKRKGAPNYKYEILSYSNNGSDLKEYPIEIKGNFLTDMQIAINDEEDIICGGFYSMKGTFSIKGSYFLKVDGETKEIKARNFKEFGIDFLTQNMTERKEKKTKKQSEKGKNVELYSYDLDDIILKDDGGAILIGEQFFYQEVPRTSMPDRNGKTTTVIAYWYYFNDIIAISMSPDGTIEWTEKIPKKQATVNDGGFFSSYALSVVKDKLYFVFNDNPKNLFYKGQGKLYNFTKSKESLVVLVELDSDGKQTREALFSAREADVLMRPLVCEQISKNEMVLFGQRKRTHRFAKITFKE